MVCGDSTIIAKIALIVMIVSVVCSTIAIFTPYWSETEGANGDKIYTGLVVECEGNLGYCVNLQDILDKYGNSEYYTDQLWSLSLAMIGWVFSIAALVVLIVYACLPNKITAILSIILCFLAGACITAAVIIYGIGFRSLVNATLSWSFGLDVAAGGLALAAMVVHGLGRPRDFSPGMASMHTGTHPHASGVCQPFRQIMKLCNECSGCTRMTGT